MKFQVGSFFLAAQCPVCGPSAFVKYGDNETKVRCLICRATPISLSLVRVLLDRVDNIADMDIYEASSRGVVVRFLRKRAKSLATSEYIPGIEPGTLINGVVCQDLHRLTYQSESFDLCTSTEVFEHVADDQTAFREIYRVLRHRGIFAFTVPLHDTDKTVERAKMVDGELIHLLPAAFHGDKLTGQNSVLVFRDYGQDIVKRLIAAGFSAANIVECEMHWFGFRRKVIVAEKR
jgi:SAM-dependent methyltransferase